MEPSFVLREVPTLLVSHALLLAVTAALVAFIVGESAAILLGLWLALDDLLGPLGRVGQRPGP